MRSQVHFPLIKEFVGNTPYHQSLEEAHPLHLQHAQCLPTFSHCMQMLILGVIFFSFTALYCSEIRPVMTKRNYSDAAKSNKMA
jgi:hypothetical protein